MKNDFTGVHWMLATPFDDDEGIDAESIPRLVRHARQAGCRAVVTLGVTGEAQRLTDRERSMVAEAVIDSADGMPVTIGATGASTYVAVSRCLEAQAMGAAAVMVAAPPMAKTNLAALLTHYRRIADAVDLPIVVQDYPQTTGVDMPPEFFAELAESVPSVRYLKLEDPPTPPKISAVRDLVGDRVAIFGGLGGVYLLDELSRGAAGAMTGFAYPEILVKVWRYMAEGDEARAREAFYRYLPLILFEAQEGIGLGIRKAALHHRGLISTSTLRHPGAQASEATRMELHVLIEELGL
jgi:4-hydroxy-tetrahydrodipicolinate synthase